MAGSGDHERRHRRLLGALARARRAALGFAAYKWKLFPEGGYVGLTDNPLQWFWHLLLPWTAAALPFAGAYTQVVRASLLEAMDEEWVKAARAKGLSEKRVMRRHVLRNGLIAPVNIWGLDFSHAFGGFALYVEVIFQVPGVGLLTLERSAVSTCRPSSRWRSIWPSSSC